MEGGEGRAMETEFYDAAVVMLQVLFWIDLCVNNKILIGRCGPKYLNNLLSLEYDIRGMLDKVFLLADPDTRAKLRSRLVLEGYGQIAATVGGESKGNTMEVVELQQARADSEIGDIFKKMLLKIYKSEEAKSTEVPKGSFQLDSISSLFNQMWDNGRQLQQLSSTDAKFLATSMLTHDTLVGHVSTLELCSEHIDWLCTWVPQFDEKLKTIKKDNLMAKKMIGMTKQEVFAAYIRRWERVCRRNNSIRFEDSTTLSSMLFTHYMPGHHPLFAGLTQTMQIFSIKITGLKGLEWPLEVYGLVAARDAVDYRRNHLFLRSRDNCQLLKDEDSYLHLTGPSRAIMSTDTVRIEFQLKVKGTMKSEDRPLITEEFACGGHGAGTSIMRSIDGFFCKLELCFEHFRRSIQATIISICVTQGSLPNGAEVICFSLPEEDAEGKDERTTNHVVLFDKKNGAVPVDEDGYLKLSRQVVPVQFEGKLKVVMTTDVMSKSVAFTPELSNISRKPCTLGDDCTLEITVAWSLLVDDEQHMMMMSYTKALMLPEKFPYMKLDQDAEVGSC